MKWEAKIITHRKESRIALYFDKNPELVNEIRKMEGAVWSRSMLVWHFPDTKDNRLFFKAEIFSGKSVLSKIHENNRDIFQYYIEQLQLKGYSPNTITSYRNEFGSFLHDLKSFSAKDCDEERIRNYILYCINTQRRSEAQIHGRLNALKFYYEKILRRPQFFLDIPRPKRPQKLPKVIAPEVVRKLFDVTTNLKHNTMLKMCYGMGLRVSEIVNLKIIDIDSNNMQVLVERGKGKKDRYVNLPVSILDQLRRYYIAYKPVKYLFEGSPGGQYAIRSVQEVFRTAVVKSGCGKKLGIHSLRHSFATHLLDQGTDIRFIQELLGHNNIQTTLLYTSVSNNSIRKIISPLDKL